MNAIRFDTSHKSSLGKWWWWPWISCFSLHNFGVLLMVLNYQLSSCFTLFVWGRLHALPHLIKKSLNPLVNRAIHAYFMKHTSGYSNIDNRHCNGRAVSLFLFFSGRELIFCADKPDFDPEPKTDPLCRGRLTLL